MAKVIDFKSRVSVMTKPKEKSFMLSQLVRAYEKHGDMPVWFYLPPKNANGDRDMCDVRIDFMRCEDKPTAIILEMDI